MTDDLTQPQRAILMELARRMRIVAAAAGPRHSWWDVISDLEAFANGEQTIVQMTAVEWECYALDLLAHRA